MRLKHFKFSIPNFDFCCCNYYQLTIAKIIHDSCCIPLDFTLKIMINTMKRDELQTIDSQIITFLGWIVTFL